MLEGMGFHGSPVLQQLADVKSSNNHISNHNNNHINNHLNNHNHNHNHNRSNDHIKVLVVS